MWQKKDQTLSKTLNFEKSDQAFDFIRSVSEQGDKLGQQPRWQQKQNLLEIEISESDSELKIFIDELYAAAVQHQKTGSATPRVSLVQAKLFSDGGSRGNPGPSASAYVIYDMEDNVVKKDGKYIGVTTNNQAEYQALRRGLEAARELGVRELQVYMDSLLVVNQLKGIYKVKNRDLWPIYQAAIDYCQNFTQVQFSHVPRELNKIADSEVNRILDEHKNSYN